MVLDRQHVAGEAGGGIGSRVRHFLFHPSARVLQLGGGVERLGIGVVQLLLQLGQQVVLGQFRRLGRGLLADLLGLVAQLVIIVDHAIHLVSAWAVKSTMGTTRA